MREGQYQTQIIKKLKALFPGCVVLKNDSNYIQGAPDLTVLYGEKWAVLEVKTSRKASTQPNQDYYIELLGDMGFAAYIYPENEEEVLNELQRSLTSDRKARLS